MFTRYIAILEVLAGMPKGGTVGQVGKVYHFLSRGQTERLLKELIADKFVRVEQVYYRPSINKNIYHITEKAVEYCEFVVKAYERVPHQQTLPLAG